MLSKRNFVGAAAGVLFIGIGAIASVAAAGTSIPADLDQSLDKTTRTAAFRLHLQPLELPVPLRRIHRWSVSVTDRTGRPVVGALIKVDGGMPQHGHGLPTKPVASPGDTKGTYIIEGVKFSMDGWWELKLDVTAAGVSDGATFNVVL